MNYKELSMKYQDLTDKLKYKGDYSVGHTYSVVYDRLFYQFKDKEINFLEIGLNFGGNIAICLDYFKKINHYGIDIVDTVLIDKSKFNFLLGSFDNIDIVNEISKRTYDIILEDASHRLDHQLKSIELYLPLLNDDGIMIIEDIQNIDDLPTLYDKIDTNTHFCYCIDLRKNKMRYDDVILVIEKRNPKFS
jgi:cephalosporin hydroxylase